MNLYLVEIHPITLFYSLVTTQNSFIFGNPSSPASEKWMSFVLKMTRLGHGQSWTTFQLQTWSGPRPPSLAAPWPHISPFHQDWPLCKRCRNSTHTTPHPRQSGLLGRKTRRPLLLVNWLSRVSTVLCFCGEEFLLLKVVKLPSIHFKRREKNESLWVFFFLPISQLALEGVQAPQASQCCPATNLSHWEWRNLILPRWTWWAEKLLSTTFGLLHIRRCRISAFATHSTLCGGLHLWKKIVGQKEKATSQSRGTAASRRERHCLWIWMVERPLVVCFKIRDKHSGMVPFRGISRGTRQEMALNFTVTYSPVYSKWRRGCNRSCFKPTRWDLLRRKLSSHYPPQVCVCPRVWQGEGLPTSRVGGRRSLHFTHLRIHSLTHSLTLLPGLFHKEACVGHIFFFLFIFLFVCFSSPHSDDAWTWIMPHEVSQEKKPRALTPGPPKVDFTCGDDDKGAGANLNLTFWIKP